MTAALRLSLFYAAFFLGAGVQLPFWPVWLAPIQVRMLPVSDDHVDGAMLLAERVPFRVDVDDRDMKLGKKVREAEKEWIPYAIAFFRLPSIASRKARVSPSSALSSLNQRSSVDE